MLWTLSEIFLFEKKKTIYIENIHCSRITKNKCENLRKKTYILNPFHFVEPHTIKFKERFLLLTSVITEFIQYM